MSKPKLPVRFFRTVAGREPVREWLKALGDIERKAIGDDIRTVQFGWPVGMPLVRKMGDDIWEVRSDLPNGISRVIFTVNDGVAILLHGFVKKDQKTPKTDIEAAKRRLKLL